MGSGEEVGKEFEWVGNHMFSDVKSVVFTFLTGGCNRLVVACGLIFLTKVNDKSIDGCSSS